MGHTVNRLLEIARAEIGYHEKNSDKNLDSKTASNDGSGNHTKYARDLHAAGYYNGDKCGFAWCDVFVDWCFFQLCGGDADKAQEMQSQSGPYGAGCGFSAQYYKKAGQYFSDPQPGDQIFFGSGSTYTHTGIVEAVDADTVTTIEGNTSNQVARLTYKRTDSSILGYGRPIYDEEEREVETVETMEKRYHKLEDLPAWAQPEVKELMDAGALEGDQNGDLDLSLDMVRVMLVTKRYTDKGAN